MVYGWAGKTLQVDLGTGKASTVPWDKEGRRFLGGRGGNAWLFWKHTKAGMNPYDPEAPVIFGSGALAATGLIGASRMEVTVVSAAKTETHSIGNVGMGGHWAPELKYAGYDNIVIKGRAEKPVYLYVYNDEVEIRDASGVWGKGTFDTETLLQEEVDDEDAQVASIGPAGENLAVQATVEHGYRSGTPVGSSMGAKKLKAVVVRGTGAVNVHDSDAVMELNRQLVNTVKDTKKRLGEAIPRGEGKDAYLQGFLVGDAGVVGNYESHEWRERPDVKKAYEENYLEEYFVKNVGCYGCPFPCQPLYEIPDVGACIWRCYPTYWPWKLWMTDLASAFKGTRMMSDLGMDNKEVATVVSWLMHLYNEGLVDAKDLDGVSFERGDPEALFETARRIAYRDGYGDALADGPVTLAKKLGKKATDYLYHNQGLTMRTFEFRAEPGTALGEVISARGNSLRATTYHVVLWDKPAREGYAGVDPKERDASYEWSKRMFGTEKAIMATEYEGKPAALIYEMNGAAIADSLGYCATMIRPGRTGAPGSQFGEASYQFAADRFKAVTGLDADEAALFQYAERICNLERAIVVRDGRTRAAETLPDFFFEAPILDGPQAGKKLDRGRFEKMKDEYYALRGWDPETGTQREPTLNKLGMADVAKELKKMKKLAQEKAAKEG
ncbi:MAG: aldehyde ferredoxin oxidoreductase C-terminal domain-containing protein [Candidatus Bathyarchaeota archaeon]